MRRGSQGCCRRLDPSGHRARARSRGRCGIAASRSKPRPVIPTHGSWALPRPPTPHEIGLFLSHLSDAPYSIGPKWSRRRNGSITEIRAPIGRRTTKPAPSRWRIATCTPAEERTSKSAVLLATLAEAAIAASTPAAITIVRRSGRRSRIESESPAVSDPLPARLERARAGMGLCSSKSAERLAKERMDQEIDRKNREDHKREQTRLRLLLLGACANTHAASPWSARPPVGRGGPFAREPEDKGLVKGTGDWRLVATGTGGQASALWSRRSRSLAMFASTRVAPRRAAQGRARAGRARSSSRSATCTARVSWRRSAADRSRPSTRTRSRR